MQFVMIPRGYRGSMSDAREHSVYWEALAASRTMEAYEAPIMRFNPYDRPAEPRRWGRVTVVPYGNWPNQTWEVTVRRWEPGNYRDADQTWMKMFNPNVDWPEAEFNLLIGTIIGRLEKYDE